MNGDLDLELMFAGDTDRGSLEGVSPPPAIDVGALDRTYTGVNIYRASARGVLDRIANLVGLSASAAKAALVQETRRYALVEDPDDPSREQVWGVAVRLAVATTNLEVKVNVTIPVVAATVELGYANARAAIDVLGYVGDLSAQLPAPTQLDVSSYALYMSSFGLIQAKVMSDRENQRATLLATRPKNQPDEGPES